MELESSSDDPPEEFDFFSATFMKLLDEELSLPPPTAANDNKTQEPPKLAAVQEAKAPPRPTKPAPGIAPPRPTTPAPAKPSKLQLDAIKSSNGNIASTRKRHEIAFPDCFAANAANAERLKLLDRMLNAEVNAAAAKEKVVKPETLNDILLFFIFSELIQECAPYPLALTHEQLDSIKKLLKPVLTKVISEINAAVTKPPLGVTLEQLRKSRTTRLKRLVAETLRAMPFDINGFFRKKVKESAGDELARILKFTDADLKDGLFRNTASAQMKTITAELRWQLEPNAFELAEKLILLFKGSYLKLAGGDENASIAALMASKNSRLAEFFAKAIKDCCDILVKQKMPRPVRRIVKDWCILIDDAALKGFKDKTAGKTYAASLKKQILPVCILNGYGGPLTEKLMANLSPFELKGATFVWGQLMSAINRAGNDQAGPPIGKIELPKAVQKAGSDAAGPIVKYLASVFDDITRHDPDISE